MKTENHEKMGWTEALVDAMYEKWAAGLGCASGLLFLSYLIALFGGINIEILLWGALALVVVETLRIYFVARAVRSGRRAPASGICGCCCKKIGAWLSVAWFFCFGLIGLLLQSEASCSVKTVAWIMVALSVVGGVFLVIRGGKKE